MRYQELSESRSEMPRRIAETLRVARRMAETLRGAVPDLEHDLVYATKHPPVSVWLLISNQIVGRTPQTVPGRDNTTGVAVKFSLTEKIASIVEITSSHEGNGGKMVDAILTAAPDYRFTTSFDLSGGFWKHMFAKYPERFISR